MGQFPKTDPKLQASVSALHFEYADSGMPGLEDTRLNNIAGALHYYTCSVLGYAEDVQILSAQENRRHVAVLELRA